MVCQRCRDAADTRAGAESHCNTRACDCQHRTDRYRPAPSHATENHADPTNVPSTREG